MCYPFDRKHGRHQAVKRRAFITLLGGAAAAWPLTARAQQGERMRRIGALISGAAEADPESRARVGALREALGQRGWSEGRNLQIDYRWAGADPSRIRTLAGLPYAAAKATKATAPEATEAAATAGAAAPILTGMLHPRSRLRYGNILHQRS
jgi:putative tryptophan/tyrosine transport system substrate-binding protein